MNGNIQFELGIHANPDNNVGIFTQTTLFIKPDNNVGIFTQTSLFICLIIFTNEKQ